MKNFVFILPLFWTFASVNLYFPIVNSSDLEEVVFPSSKLEDLKSLKNFVQLVSEKKLNVSLVLSKTETKGDISLEFSTAITFPLVKELLTQATLNEEDGRKFLDAARSDKLAAKVSLDEEEGDRSWKNSADGIPITNAHTILTSYETKQKGYRWQDKNYLAQYTFFTEESDGKNETVKVLFADFNIQVIDSYNFTDAEIIVSKRELTAAFIDYTPNDFQKALVAMFSAAFPGHKWQIVTDIGENNYIKAKKMISLKLDNTIYMLYSI